MKKLLAAVLLTVFMSAAVFAKANDDQEFIIKAGVQPQTTASLDGSNYDTNIGISAGFEYFKYFGNIFAAGAGASYDFPREFKESGVDGCISFVPMFVGVKVRTPLEGLNNNYGFLTGRLGYSAFMNDDMNAKSSSGGLYCGIGIGVSISYLVLEAIYAVSNYSYTVGSGSARKTYDEKYSTISIYAGFKFE
ncbi:MAG: hypothetical protein FWH43_04685 [Endomicrobia bacterium]|nr:hypothetical protein [Endomicrobiia bacterium]